MIFPWEAAFEGYAVVVAHELTKIKVDPEVDVGLDTGADVRGRDRSCRHSRSQ